MYTYRKTLECLHLGHMLGSGRIQRLLVFRQRIYNHDRHHLGHRAYPRVLEPANALFEEDKYLYHDGTDFTLGNCHSCQSDILALVYR